MGSRDYGAFAQCTRFLLAVINVIFLILGLTVLITAIILRYGSSEFSKLIDIPDINSVIDAAGSISGVTIFLLILGGFIILLSLFGILGVRYMNRFFLIVYEIIIIAIFVAQIIAVLVLVFSSSSIADSYKEKLGDVVKDIQNNQVNNTEDAKKKCALMHGLSDVFKCCGAKGPGDFADVNTTLTGDCCVNKNPNQPGCANKTVDDVEKNVVNLLVIPTAIILVIEFFAIITVPFLVGKAGKKSGYEYD